MRKILIVGSGLTGCQLLTKILLHHDINRLSKLTQIAFVDLFYAVEQYQSLSLKTEVDKIVLTSIGSCIPDLGTQPKKKPRYIRQQHKLAQRHFRRK